MATLKLTFEKGPRTGESLEFLWKNSPIKIGRVVRGNRVPIKDPGISTKHLIIEFNCDRWIITDLGSCNGTVLNGLNVSPNCGVVLKDGDCFKIGEVTVIRVRVFEHAHHNIRVDEEKKPKGGMKRDKVVEGNAEENVKDTELRVLVKENTKPRGRQRKGKMNEAGENVDDTELGVRVDEEGLGDELGKEEKKQRGRARREQVVEGNNVEDAERGLRRNTRRRVKLEVNVEDTELGKDEKPPTGRTRRAKPESKDSALNVQDMALGLGEDLGQKDMAKAKRPTRGRPKKVQAEIYPENEICCSIVDEGIREGKILNIADSELVLGEDLVEKVVVKPKRPTRERPKKVQAEICPENEISNSFVDKGIGAEKGGSLNELGTVKAEPGPQISTRRTRSMKDTENGEKEDLHALIDGIKMSEKGRKRKQNNNDNSNNSKNNDNNNNINNILNLGAGEGNGGNLINVQSGDRLNSEKVVVKSEPQESFCEVETVGNLCHFETDKEGIGKRGECNVSDLSKEGCVKEKSSKEGVAPDPAKMALGDYFDYLDVYLPNLIYKETEQIISEMEQKAEKFRELVREHGKDKLKSMQIVQHEEKIFKT